MTQEEAVATPGTQSMEDLLSQEEYSYQQPKRGEIRTGTIVSVSPGEIVVDVGVKREGLVSSRDLERLSADEVAAISVGEEVSVYVVKPEDQDGNLIVSLHLAEVQLDWQKAEEYLKSQEIFEGEVSGYNKGGVVVPFGKIRGFVPASQLVGFPRRLSQTEKIDRLAQQVGRETVVQVVEVDRRRKRLIMSEQAAQSKWQEQQRHRLMDSLVEGQVVHGTVTSLANFGTFVDVGGADGLIHISEMSWHRIRHPREVLQVGDEVDVYVLKLDHAHQRIGLSLRRLQPDPWTLVDTKYAIGQRVEGTITNTVDFGAFAHLEDGIEGLIHLSELSDAEINHASEIVKRGEQYLLEVIKIEPERQRIGLSLKRVPPVEQDAWRAAQAPPAADETDVESAPAEFREPASVPEETTELATTAEGTLPAEDETLEAAPSEPEPEAVGGVEHAEADASRPTDETGPDILPAQGESLEAASSEPKPEAVGGAEHAEADASRPTDETGPDILPAEASSALEEATADTGEPQLETIAEEPVA